MSDRFNIVATFAAKYVPALAEISNGEFYHPQGDWTGNRNELPGIQIEPHEKEGVWLVATNGHVLVWIHDRGGRASEPCILDIDDAFISACTPPKLPEVFDANRIAYPSVVPDWLRADKVIVVSEDKGDLPHCRYQSSPESKSFCSVCVETAGLPPGIESDEEVAGIYASGPRSHGRSQTIKREMVPFRDFALGSRDPVPAARVRLNSDYLLRLCKIGGPIDLTLHGELGTVLFDFPAYPEIHGALMPIDPAQAKKVTAAELALTTP